jgi:RecA DNA recombination protein
MANIGEALQDSLHWKAAQQLIEQKRNPKFAALPIPAFIFFPKKDLARGIIAQIFGARSSGRATVSLHILAQATQRGEVCAVVDLKDGFNPGAAAHAGVCLERLVWVRCRGNVEHALRAADLLLHAGGFGVVLLDLCEAAPRMANRIPLSYWFRFQREIENTPTILLVCGDRAYAQTCSPATVELQQRQFCWTGEQSFLLLRAIEMTAILSNQSNRPSAATLESVA